MHYENFYENVEEAAFRLNNTIVLYDGNPVYVHSLENHKDGIIRVQIVDLPVDENLSGTTTRKMINSPKFNKFRPFEIGNVNVLTHTGVLAPHRVERVPARTRLQGANSGNHRIAPIGKSAGIPPTYNWNSLIQNEGFVEAIKGIYPTLQEYFKAETDSACLSRDLTVVTAEKSGMSYVYYKFDPVGVLNSNGVVFLFPKFTYLKEALDATGIFVDVKIDFFK